ncbi:MAG: UvrD-helicase domain-containing protein [Candidatus Azobacteroides sp.]|nr:UvrD-helicase domain-containing protein [Candidatus Azobacteroides sp.]
MKKEFTPIEEQQKVLDLKEGIHLALAPPGSGKTELLAQRVFDAKNSGLPENNIICLTFTNRAAKGMKERIEDKYPNSDIIIGNVHRFCSLFLFQNNLIPLNTSILDEEDTNQMFEELKRELNYPSVYNPDLLKLATYLKQKELGFSEDLFLKPKGSDIPDLWTAKALCEAYNKGKQKNNYLDFDDLLTLTYYHLTHTDKKQLLLSQFTWLQVDEVQDLNPLQWAIIHEITAPNALVVYFGDYEQAIFSFMGAKLDSLHHIEKICKSNPKNSVLNLCKNFRSPSYLLDIYIKYAETHWTPTWKQRPFSHATEQPPEKALCLFEIKGTIMNEANYISKNILPPLLFNEDKTAIIVRFNKSADSVSDSLKRQGIPHFKISGFDLFRRKSVKGLMALFSIFQNEYDRLSWARIFYEFDIIKTLKECRAFINNLNNKGMTPIDILKYHETSSRLNEFFTIFSNKEMIVFDTETTGLNTENDDIIQIAAVKIANGQIKDTFEVYINTEKDVTESEKIHHISQAYLNSYAVSHEKGLLEFMQFMGENAVLVAHNIGYDYSILEHNLQRYCKKSLSDYCEHQFDSINITKLIYPNLASYKLSNLLDFLNVEGVNSHNALDDVKATVALIEKLNLDFYNGLKQSQNNYLSDLQNKLIFNKFIVKFKPLFSLIQQELNSCEQLSKIICQYFDYNPYSDDEMKEIDKLLKHIDFYTDKGAKLNLRQKIDKYLPEYRMFKESDLYLGTEKVVVSTVYKAKGLEFDNVIVAEATNDIYPYVWMLEKNYRNARSEEEKMKILKQIQERTLEDARAFYVAMTRSKKKLYITLHTQSPWGHAKSQTNFIDCIANFFERKRVTTI